MERTGLKKVLNKVFQIALPLVLGAAILLWTYHDFDLKMEQIEIKAMAEQAAGCYVALKCLNAVAEKSGYHVNTPTLPDYMKDLDTIQRGFDALYLYAPQNGDGHSTDLLPNKNYRGIDYGRPTSTDVGAWQTFKREGIRTAS